MIDYQALLPSLDETRRGSKVHPDQTLFAALLSAVETYKSERLITSDYTTQETLTYNSFLARSIALSQPLMQSLSDEERNIGIMLPTGMTTMVCFFAVQYLNRVATMLNFTAGAAALVTAVQAADLRTVITSSSFIERVGLGQLVDILVSSGLKILYIEDLLASAARQRAKMPEPSALLTEKHPLPKSPDSPAVILFTSGSEGIPKGVALSHRNILSNIAQFTESLDVGSWDHMFACLPLYHSFGLTVGALLPIFTGMPTTYFPSPLHYHDVPKAIAATQATILLTTDTFLNGYARTGVAQDFMTLRYVVAGAEKLKDQTRDHWAVHFGKVIMEGYGVTETSPVLSVNRPDCYRPGTVGPLLPHIEAQLRPVEGITQGAELWVRGPNVMLGYMRAEAPGIIEPLPGGFNNTGDIALLDADGFLSIVGRTKRFAKIGGEMVSLIAIEQAVTQIHPESAHVVVSVPHARRGECIVLLTTHDDTIQIEAIRTQLRAKGLSDLTTPREIIRVPRIPILGSGKVDFGTARSIAMEELLRRNDLIHKRA